MQKHILFIEDESVLQKTISTAFEREGIRVTAALDGAIGLRLAHQLRPDIILLDLILPKMDGFEV
ncbi:MAG: response regulator, partial [Parcubacteria group bacterium]|nr:response regulator [Parcubacteria group bacterium]